LRVSDSPRGEIQLAINAMATPTTKRPSASTRMRRDSRLRGKPRDLEVVSLTQLFAGRRRSFHSSRNDSIGVGQHSRLGWAARRLAARNRKVARGTKSCGQSSERLAGDSPASTGQWPAPPFDHLNRSGRRQVILRRQLTCRQPLWNRSDSARFAPRMDCWASPGSERERRQPWLPVWSGPAAA
jgi:hypothetical protein